MTQKEFIKEQVTHLKNDISERDVMLNVRQRTFALADKKEAIENIINKCMELYAEIYLETYR